MDPSNFKTYDELKEKLNRVLTGSRITETVDNVDLPPQESTTSVQMPEVNESAPASDDDDTLSYFSKLADED